MEQYGLGGTDTVLANIFNNWPDPKDEIIYLTNRDNQGLLLIKNIVNKNNVRFQYIDFKFKPSKQYASSKSINSIIRNALSLITFFTRIFTLYIVLRKIKPEMLISNNGGYPAAYSCQSILMSARLLGVKKVFLVVHHSAVAIRKHFLLFEILMDFLVKICIHKFIAVSEASKLILHKSRGFPLSKIKVIYNGLDCSSPLPKIDLRKRYNIDTGERIIGCVANLLPHKGHKVLIGAYNRSKIKDSSTLLIIGRKMNPTYCDCLELVKELNLEKRVIFCGFLEDHPSSLIRQLDALVLPTLDFEGFGLVLGEALLSGVPAVATSVGAIPEILVNREHCILVEPNDDHQLSCAIDEVFENRTAAQEMTERAKNHFLNNYSASIMSQKYRDLYFIDKN